ncbi:MAG: nucleotide exchange factor GrpE [Bacteroidales bacterium]|nr:nucleotide exchange factor GrpE [Bacteroidales bacterium]
MSKKNKEKQTENLSEEARKAEENTESQIEAEENNNLDKQEASAQEEPEQEKDEAKAQENPENQQEGNWEDKYNQLNDKHLRLFSEFDNYRKRTMREKADLIKSASADLIREMLTLIDDMDRAIEAVPEEQEEARKGMLLIRDKFVKLLKQKGLEEMDSKGKEFNTDYHEAVTQIPAPSEDMKGKVVDVVEKGYFLNDKVLRFAKVVVGK